MENVLCPECKKNKAKKIIMIPYEMVLDERRRIVEILEPNEAWQTIAPAKKEIIERLVERGYKCEKCSHCTVKQREWEYVRAIN